MYLYDLLPSKLLEGYPEAVADFLKVNSDKEAIDKTIASFRDLVNRNQVAGNEKNIDWWRKQGWENFQNFVNQKKSIPTKTQEKRKKIPGKSLNLVDNERWLIVIPLDKNASCFHGKNSDWCTTKPTQPYFEQYFYDREVTLIYCLEKQTGGMWAIAAHKKLEGKWEIFNQQDRSISDSELYQETGLNVNEIVDLALNETNQPVVSSAREGYKESVKKTNDMMAAYGKTPATSRNARNQEIEKELSYNKNSQLCFRYIKLVVETLSIKEKIPSRQYLSIPEFPEDIAIAALGYDAVSILYFKNPSERMQLTAIQEDAINIRFISEPSLKVQEQALDQDIGAAQFIKNIDPSLLKKFPEVKNLLRLMPDEEYNKFLPRIREIILEATDEILMDWEASDDYFSQWQAEQARELGFLLDPDGNPYTGDPDDLDDWLEEKELDIRDMDVDWDRVQEDDSLNSYLEYNYDASIFYRDANEVIEEMTPENIREWTMGYMEEHGDEGEAPEINEIEKILKWKLDESSLESLGELVLDRLYVRKNKDGEYKIGWNR